MSETTEIINVIEEQKSPNDRSVKDLPIKNIALSDKIITNIIAKDNDIHNIAEDKVLTNAEKIDKLRDLLTIRQTRLGKVKRKADQEKYLESIELIRQYLELFSDGTSSEDEDDMNIFDVIGYNAKLVALKKSNALIVTGDAGVGKTHEVIAAIRFLNPIKDITTVEVDINSDEDIEELDEDLGCIEPVDNKEEVEEIENILTENIEAEISASIFGNASSPLQTAGTPIKKAKEIPPKKKEAGDTKTKIIKVANSRNNADSGYYIASGGCTRAALYELLFIHRHKLLIFDDFDSILKDDECVNLLKAALDTYPIREISRMTKNTSFDSRGMSDNEMWDEYELTQKVPNQFKFSGNIIFISNIHEDKFDKALMSRSLHVEVRLSKKQLIERMHELMPKIRTEVDIVWKLEALHELENIVEKYVCKFNLNIRSLIHAIDIRNGIGEEKVIINGKEVPMWKKLLKKQIVKSRR